MIFQNNGKEITVRGSEMPKEATHLAVNKKEGYKNFFCYKKDGTFWTLVQEKGEIPSQSSESFCSLTSALFDFFPL